MRKIEMASIAFVCLLIFSISASWGTTQEQDIPPWKKPLYPVQSITLTYDLNKASLHVEAAHPSDNWGRDYVRMMTVSLNGQEVSTLNYSHQTMAGKFLDDVPFNAQVGDVITVALFCTGGTSMSQDLTVKKPEESQPNQNADTSTT